MKTANRPPSQALRAATILAFTVLAIFWLLLGLVETPWLVLADHSSDLVQAAKQASRAAYCLFALSLVAIWLPTGLLARRAGWLIACGVLVGWVAAGVWLFPRWAFVDFPWRLAAHTLGGAMLVVWIGKFSSR